MLGHAKDLVRIEVVRIEVLIRSRVQRTVPEEPIAPLILLKHNHIECDNPSRLSHITRRMLQAPPVGIDLYEHLFYSCTWWVRSYMASWRSGWLQPDTVGISFLAGGGCFTASLRGLVPRSPNGTW